ncbi:MAG TPA: hypothetical protein VFO58_05405 [Vicinamibacterales bacterium]|nr:hypothetical protein [Vicinamibacterales bacterium]
MTRRSFFLSLLAVCSPLVLVVGCGGSSEEEANAPFTVTYSSTYLTIRNQLGSAITEGQIELVPSGVLAPFRTNLPRIEPGSSRDILFTQFGGTGGARFMRGSTRIKFARVTATDSVGTQHKREIPFE